MTSDLPIPPDELIDRVVSGFSNEQAQENRALFLQTGQRSLEDLERALAAVDRSLATQNSILEFGCGCGRIMRWMEDVGSTKTLAGTDIDKQAIKWASENISFASFAVNDGLPPTNYEDGEFDLIINHSVFTHLDESYQDQWLAELQRITAPGGLLVLSTHGEHAFQTAEQQLPADSHQRRQWRETLERDGILFISDDAYVGSAFPDFYHTTFHAPWYLFAHWSQWFDVLAVLPQSSLAFQDQIVLRRPDERSPKKMPLGRRAEVPSTIQTQSTSDLTDESLSAAIENSLAAPTQASRFGSLGLTARKTIFRAARPILHNQRRINRQLAKSLALIEARQEERMPPLVHVVFRQQSERIDRLERQLEEDQRS
ncbi:MAG: class I SAM-dependent methyltransferase [Solirubrobacteraceae bacterium]